MKRLKFNCLIVAAVASSLYGCATPPKQTVGLSAYEAELIAEHKRTEEVIAKAALLSSKALAVYVRTNQALVQPVLSAEQIRQAQFQESHIPNGMEPENEMGWDGAPEPLLSRIAAMSGYRVEYENQRPPVSRGMTMSPTRRNLRQMIAVVEQQSIGYIEKISIVDEVDNKVIRVIYSQF